MKPTQEQLNSRLSYDPLTGIFLWRARDVKAETARTDKAWNTRYIGKQAGCINPSDGYVQIYIDHVRHAAHRLAFVMQTGEWPADSIDHINGVRADNRWSNLRECSVAENNRNAGPLATNTSGFKGVFTATGGRSWFAQIGTDGGQRYLGSFPTKEEAAAAYDDAALEMHGAFAKLNEPMQIRPSGVTP